MGMGIPRDFRSHRTALFDGIEEGAITTSAYSSQIHERQNDQAMDSLHDRVSVLKRQWCTKDESSYKDKLLDCQLLMAHNPSVLTTHDEYVSLYRNTARVPAFSLRKETARIGHFLVYLCFQIVLLAYPF
ncbi:uncharacterized protein LOC102710326 isoform X6 [Oryza brachyantha]|uniref:uncharacterized protein LOC102710326 isoform X6 n=1 Tax=Oryza brachyantha TaxID=4533 RepID=UPI001AD9A169|nr:uncharacterized protein LOC102710326 isoform X6 [Oryza brachyantha]